MTHQKINSQIVMLSWEYPPNLVGGLGRHVSCLAKSLVKIGYTVDIITAKIGELPPFESIDGVQIHRVLPLHSHEEDFLLWIAGLNLTMVEYVIDLPNVHDIDIIHTHDWLTSSAAITLATELDVPLIATIHATEAGRNNGIYTDMQRFINNQEVGLMDKADRLIVCSEYMKKEIVTALKVKDEEKISVIPNGVDWEQGVVDQKQDKTLPIFPKKRMVFSMGRMVTEKGFDLLIETAKILKQTHPDLYYIIAGKGPLLETHRETVRKENLIDTVFFIGHINDQQRNILLKACEVSVFPSRYEPFGIVALEAMSSGKPVIVSDTGGFKEIVEDFKSGMFMKPGNVRSLINRLMQLLGNKEQAISLGEQGKKWIHEHYRWDTVAKETKKVYERFNKANNQIGYSKEEV